MAGNSNLHDSARNKQDEFYTQLSLIENELKHYKQHFKGKVVFCNCDDPFESNFFKYFAMNFNALGLKKLIATCYCLSPVFGTEIDLFDPKNEKKIVLGKKRAVQFRIAEIPDMNGDGAISLEDAELLIKKRRPYRILKGDKKYSAGDFRSNECVELLKEADIVVTNPPFSLFREYVTQLIEHEKQFLIIGNLNAVTYKEILPLVMNNKVWIGYNSGHYWFKVPNTYEIKKTDFKIDENGQKWRRMGNICWFTNMDIEKRHENMTLFRNYNPNDYPKYDNYDAIDVSKTADIPCDYFEAIGVPITYLTKFNPEQFELLGIDKDFTTDGGRFLINDNNSHGGGGTALIRSARYSAQELKDMLSQEYDIPENEIIYHSGIMGVPITFMTKHNPAQFEIIGKIDAGELTEFNLGRPVINGVSKYKRIAIRRTSQ